MIESLENAAQLTALFICLCVAVPRAFTNRSRAWVLLAFFFGSFMLGDLYWQACLIFYEDTPAVSVVSDVSWYASYVFLYMLLREVSPPEKIRKKSFFPYAGPVFAAGMAIFFMQWGKFFSNAVTGALMGLLLYASIIRLLPGNDTGSSRSLSLCVLLFCLAEHAVWTASCFWEYDTLLNPYYWFDIFVSLLFFFFLSAVKKAVKT